MADLYGKIADTNTEVQSDELPIMGEPQTIVDEKTIQEAAAILEKYKAGKSKLEERIVQGELWYQLQHWEALRQGHEDQLKAEPTSAWLFNTIMNKHADAMDNFPEPVVLPRERSDEESAKNLSSILPVLMETNDVEDTYSDQWWEKLKHGTGVYGIFWNPEKEEGMGDVDIRGIDLLKIFWEPGIEDIQDSRNLFIVDLVDEDILNQQYPDHAGKLKGNAIDVRKYIYTESVEVDTTEKVLVVDWYYKTKVNGHSVLQYCKFCGSELLFASENDPMYRERGWYDHGMYPVVFDVLFPEKGTPVGFGYVSICKDPQLYIDKLYGNILEASLLGTRKRFFISNSTGVNEEEFADWSKQLVHVEGELGEERIREIIIQPPAPIYDSIIQQKIDEMKETSANRDVNSGSTGSQVTAAAAIAALQEAGNKTSRDMIAASYRKYRQMLCIVVELVRQFYDLARSFRITGMLPGQYDFIQMSNAELKPQPTGVDAMGQMLFRKPIFDLKIKAQKRNPFSRMEENERAKELYGMGFFDPMRAQEALAALDMMDFEGIDKVREQVAQGQTLLNIVQQLTMQLQMMQGVMGMAQPAAEGQPTEGRQKTAPEGENPGKAGRDNPASGIMQARTPMTSYGQRLAERSKPSIEGA